MLTHVRISGHLGTHAHPICFSDSRFGARVGFSEWMRRHLAALLGVEGSRRAGDHVHLQNYEPPAAPTTSQGTNFLPPQIQQWMQAGALLLPSGLLPQGLIPGSQPAVQEAQVARFHNFRILGWMTLNDASLKNDLYDVLGKESGFATPNGPGGSGCMYAEFGFAFQSAQNAPSSDLLVSLSCNQVAPIGFTWPFANKTGLNSDTSKRIVTIAQTTFGG